MPLLERRAFEEYFVCPRCFGPLVIEPYYCESCDCVFLQVRGKPVLVAFEYSVLDAESLLQTEASSLIARRARGGLLGAAVKAIHGTNQVAPRECNRLVELVNKGENRPRLLIIGGGAVGSGLRELYERRDIDLIAFDIYDSPDVQFIADAHRIPLKDHSVDGVVIQAVLEHVLDPYKVVSEIQRVLRKGGAVYAETPFLQHVHEGAYDFVRFTEGGHRYLFRYFNEINAGVVSGLGTQMTWSIDHLCRGVFRSHLAGRVAAALFFWLRWADYIIPTKYAIDGASGCFFLGTLNDTPITPRDTVSRYRGAQ
jgi:SAM-dependent methyltransferase